MIEARIFTDSFESAKGVLATLHAVEKGRYRLGDVIFHNIDTRIPLADEFLRLRVVPENIWDEKPVILAVKRTELKKVGKNSHIPVKLQFDTKDEAEAYYNEHFKDTYEFDFFFSRVGWQYDLSGGDQVDLEVVNDTYPTIEFKSKTDDGMKKLLKAFTVDESTVIKGPSVVAIREML